MKLGVCPCCGSRNLKKLQGEQFTCLDCNAPLRFTWGAGHGIGIVLPMILPNVMQQFSEPIRYGVPAVLLVVLLIFYFRFRRFHLDAIGINEAINTAQDDLRQIDKFLAGKTGVVDFIAQIGSLKNTYGKAPSIQKLIIDSFNRVGGISVDEQADAVARTFPDIDFKKIAGEQAEEATARIAQLNAYQVKN